jgi:hypothetical protein
MLPILLGTGAKALGFFKNHWGKIISAMFVIMWIGMTSHLYGKTIDLTMALGASESAVSVCIAQRANMDGELLLLKSDIALIQADNAEYKAKLQQAEISILNLEESFPVVIQEIDEEVIPESCEGSMDWMLNRVLNK